MTHNTTPTFTTTHPNYRDITLATELSFQYDIQVIAIIQISIGRSMMQNYGYTGRTAEAPLAYIGMDRCQGEAFDQTFLQAITDEAIRRNWQILELEFFDDKPPDGIKLDGIFMRALANQGRTEQLRRFTGNLIRIGSALNDDDHILPAVLPDLKAQGQLAASHFAHRGFSRIGFVRRVPWSIWYHFYDGVESCAKKKGMEIELLSLPAFFSGDKSSHTMVFEAFSKWVRAVPKPIGLVCVSDGFAARLCAWIRNAGLRVPTDVAILGAGNDTAVCERCLPRLSSVRTSEYERGVAACELMASMMLGKKPPRKPVFIPPSGVTVRESTDVLASVNPDVANALSFMWTNIAKDLSVDDVADHVGIHRRKLERAFRSEFGRGVNAEIKRRRLEKSCELLSSTEATVIDISLQVGFHSDDYFYRAFKRKFGKTPLQWRNEHQKD